MSQYPSPVGGAVAVQPPQVVHIVSRSGGLARSVFFVLGLFLFAAVFAIGVLTGVGGMVAGAALDEAVIRHEWREGGSSVIAVIPVVGAIDESQSMFVRAAVDHVLDDSNVRAVVLRVDSPGGGVTESDQIWYEVERLKKAGLPVVASYGGMAASGGYYVSCGADEIIAEQTCITGSIGVIAQIMTLEGLMGKVGIQPVTLVATGSPEKSVANDMFRSWNDADKARIRTVLDAAYATFNKRVRDGRGKVIGDSSRIDALANGAIYTATQALEGGLVDGIGYLDDAIAKAEARGGVPVGRSTVVMISTPPTLFGNGLLVRDGGSISLSSLDAASIRNLVNDLAAPRLMYLMH